MEVDEGVVTIGEVVDLVGELALAPLFHLIDGAVLLDQSLELFHDGLGLFLGEVGVENVQDLVLFGGLSH